MRLFFFLTQKTLLVSFVDGLFSARDSAMGLARRGPSRRGVPREPPRLQYYANRTEPQIFITSRRARIKD